TSPRLSWTRPGSWRKYGETSPHSWPPRPPGTSSGFVCATLYNFMGMGNLGQALTAKEIFDLVKPDLQRVEEEIALESVSSVEAITTIGRYLQSSGGKRLRPSLV